MEKQLKIDSKRTKIIATLGPSITQDIMSFEDLKNPKKKSHVAQAYAKMKEIILNGVTCVRLNLSHGSHEEHAVRIKIVRDVAAELKRNVAIMLDTKGPEIRIDKCSKEKVEINEGDKVDIYTTKKVVGTRKCFSCSDSSGTYVDPVRGIIKTTALNSHFIKENKRINLPECDYSIPFLSKKDITDIEFACSQNCDYISASFVNNAHNIHEIREVLQKNNKLNIQIVAKIESSNAINNIDEIYEAADAVMVARGDLALEIPYYDVPY